MRAPDLVVIVPESGVRAASQELIEELMGVVVAVDFALTTLMSLPTDALPGEDKAVGTGGRTSPMLRPLAQSFPRRPSGMFSPTVSRWSF